MTAATYLVGDVFARMRELPDQSVDLVMTSPPFYRLRSYLPDGHPDKHLEIGSELSPAEYLDVMLALTAEWGRLLAPHGSIVVELGDTYAGSGGAGGDYDDDGLREGQNRFNGSAKASDRPEDKSLLGIPDAYALSLEYGWNVLRRNAPDSPAGKWRVRNKVAWVRPNPPVGALGDRFRNATSYLTVATRARDRWFDLDSVRTKGTEPGAVKRKTKNHSGANPSTGWASDNTEIHQNPAGAPPLDWWNHVDLLIDNEIATRAGKYNSGEKHKVGQSSASKGISGGDSGNPDKPRDTGARTIGAQGSHIRRRLEAAGYFGGPTDDVWDIAPSGYPGAHYAVYPPELCVRPILAMSPRRVCLTCGQPSRRIVGDRSAFARQPELAAHIKERREALGITSADLNGWFGYKEIAKNWERTDRHGAAIPNPDDWPILKDRLGLSDDFDDLVLGERRWTESTVEYGDGAVRGFEGDRAQGRGGHQGMPRADRLPVQEWSDCGHDSWRPGHVLDPFAGTGTTLAVATGHGRTATGIDIDPRNAGLALDRIGPLFLHVEWPPGDLTLPALPAGNTDPDAYDTWLTDKQAEAMLAELVDWWETSWPPTPGPETVAAPRARRAAVEVAGQLDMLLTPAEAS